MKVKHNYGVFCFKLKDRNNQRVIDKTTALLSLIAVPMPIPSTILANHYSIWCVSANPYFNTFAYLCTPLLKKKQPTYKNVLFLKFQVVSCYSFSHLILLILKLMLIRNSFLLCIILLHRGANILFIQVL